MGWRGLPAMGRDTKRKLYLRKRHFFVMEKYIEDAKQEEKDVPDLVEPIMRPTDPAKEELRRILFEMGQLKPKITKIKVGTFWMSGKIRDFRRKAACRSKVDGF